MGAERENSYLNLISQPSRPGLGDYEESQSLLEDAISAQPKRSDAYLETGGLPLPRAAATRGLWICWTMPAVGQPVGLEGEALGNIYYIQGNCYYELGDYDRSMRCCSRLCGAKPVQSRLTTQPGGGSGRSGQTADAEKCSAPWKQMGAGRADTDMVRAEIAAISGRYQESALDYYRQVFGRQRMPIS